jgi:hypothetical protein
MANEPSRVIVVLTGARTSVCVYHREFPEIRAEGASPKEAASHLQNKLSCTLDSALTDWRRQTVESALADVKTFLERQP